LLLHSLPSANTTSGDDTEYYMTDDEAIGYAHARAGFSTWSPILAVALASSVEAGAGTGHRQALSIPAAFLLHNSKAMRAIVENGRPLLINYRYYYKNTRAWILAAS
jgi:hypothetical protein